MDDLELIRLLSRAATASPELDPALRTYSEIVCDHLGGSEATVWRGAGRGWAVTHHYLVDPATMPAAAGTGELPEVVGAMLRADVTCSLWHEGPARARRVAVLVRGALGAAAVIVIHLDGASVDTRAVLAICESVADLLGHVARRDPSSGPTLAGAAPADLDGQRSLEYDLRAACEQWSFDIAYQPVVSLAEGDLVGTEALVRWRRPGHGPVSPAEFVPVVERLGLAPRLGAQVLLDACSQTAEWRRAHPSASELTVAVNLSVRQLDELDVVEVVEEALERSGLPPEALVLELTESSLPTDTAGALARLWALRHLGVGIAIDDFGTGYSSLSRLRELPVDVLKIDRSFLEHPERDHAILEALFAMARTLGLQTVAEGVETPAQLQAVMADGCDLVQGYLFARPLPSAGIARLLADPGWDTDELAEDSAAGPTWTPTDLDALLAGYDHDASWEHLEELLRATADATGTDSVYVTTVDLAGGVQHIDVAANTGALEVVAGEVLPWATSPCRRALRDGVAVLHDVAVGHADLAIGTVCSVAVRGPDGTLNGTLCAVSARRHHPGEVAIELLRRIAQLIGTAIGRTREHAWIDAMSDSAVVAR